MSDPIHQRFDQLVDIQKELETVLQSVVLNDSTIIDALAQLLGHLFDGFGRMQDAETRLAEEIHALGLKLDKISAGGGVQPIIAAGADQTASKDPEFGLLDYLYSYLPCKVAIDIGANVGALSQRLLDAGYEVYAFEPNPPAYAELTKRLGGNKRFHPFNMAVGRVDATMNLNIASDLSTDKNWDVSLFHSLLDHPMLDDLMFQTSIPVQVRSLESLRKSGEIPAEVGILKIDAEGYDLEILRGMGNAPGDPIPVLMTEFWDAAHPFGRAGHGRILDIITEAQARGYRDNLVIYRVDETSTMSFYCNSRLSIPKSWGNAAFFADPALFRRAVNWLEAVMRPTVFK